MNYLSSEESLKGSTQRMRKGLVLESSVVTDARRSKEHISFLAAATRSLREGAWFPDAPSQQVTVVLLHRANRHVLLVLSIDGFNTFKVA